MQKHGDILRVGRYLMLPSCELEGGTELSLGFLFRLSWAWMNLVFCRGEGAVPGENP